jgi:hypothetical protein
MHIGRLPMDCWFLIAAEWKIEVIFIKIYLIKLAKIYRKIRKFSQIIFVGSHGDILLNKMKIIYVGVLGFKQYLFNPKSTK